MSLMSPLKPMFSRIVEDSADFSQGWFSLKNNRFPLFVVRPKFHVREEKGMIEEQDGVNINASHPELNWPIRKSPSVLTVKSKVVKVFYNFQQAHENQYSISLFLSRDRAS